MYPSVFSIMSVLFFKEKVRCRKGDVLFNQGGLFLSPHFPAKNIWFAFYSYGQIELLSASVSNMPAVLWPAVFLAWPGWNGPVKGVSLTECHRLFLNFMNSADLNLSLFYFPAPVLLLLLFCWCPALFKVSDGVCTDNLLCIKVHVTWSCLLTILLYCLCPHIPEPCTGPVFLICTYKARYSTWPEAVVILKSNLWPLPTA